MHTYGFLTEKIKSPGFASAFANIPRPAPGMEEMLISRGMWRVTYVGILGLDAMASEIKDAIAIARLMAVWLP